MKEPIWISRSVIETIQDELLIRFGGLPGLRDAGLLESALHKPQQAYCYGNPDLFDLAALYAFGIVKNHPFLDGNKRAGFMAAYTFLGANGCVIEATEADVVAHTLALASGEIDERVYAVFLRATCPAKRRPVRRKARPAASR